MKLTIGIVLCLQLCAQLLADPVPGQQSDLVPEQQTGVYTDSDFTVTADNQMELYIDGVKVDSLKIPNANTWTVSDTVVVPAYSRVIAIKAVDVGVVAGILATGARANTDASWKCTNDLHPGWNEVDFNDDDWPQAVLAGAQGSGEWTHIVNNISPKAQWIWTENHVYADSTPAEHTAYCRKTRNVGCDHDNKPCVRSCSGVADGDYQHCRLCNVYVTCSNGILYDKRPCAPSIPPLVWDDSVKRCEWKSTTCFRK